MIGYLYTITNRAGQSFNINDFSDENAVTALQSYPNMDIDIKNTEAARDGQNGIWDFNSFYGKRNISFSGVIVAADEAAVEVIRRAIQAVVSLPLQPSSDLDGYVTISWTDAMGEGWQIEAKIDRAPRFERSMRQQYRLDFLLSFKAPDPFIVGQEEITQNGYRGYYSTDTHFPIMLPLIIAPLGVNAMDVLNTGSAAAHTIIRLYGEDGHTMTNPTILNINTGKRMKIDHDLADATEYIEIDSKAGTVVDQDGNDLIADISVDSEFILLTEGSNELLYTTDQDPSSVGYLPSAAFSVTFRSTRI